MIEESIVCPHCEEEITPEDLTEYEEELQEEREQEKIEKEFEQINRNYLKKLKKRYLICTWFGGATMLFSVFYFIFLVPFHHNYSFIFYICDLLLFFVMEVSGYLILVLSKQDFEKKRKQCCG